MRKFIVAPGPHAPQLAIQGHDLTRYECQVVQRVVTNQHMDTDDYKLGREAGVFLQGFELPYKKDGKDGWILVEFWTYNHKAIKAFVDHLNEEINKPKPDWWD